MNICLFFFFFFVAFGLFHILHTVQYCTCTEFSLGGNTHALYPEHSQIVSGTLANCIRNARYCVRNTLFIFSVNIIAYCLIWSWRFLFSLLILLSRSSCLSTSSDRLLNQETTMGVFTVEMWWLIYSRDEVAQLEMRCLIV